jgi:LPXTG-motif cell wall-anchored protein
VLKADGSPVTDIFGNPVTTTTTDASGYYLFDNLPFGSYRVDIANPIGYIVTLSGVGATDTDSSELTVTSVNLTVDGASDLTLDFGFCREIEVPDNSTPVTPAREAVTAPGKAYVFDVSSLGEPSKGAEFIPSKTVIADQNSSNWSKRLIVSAGVWSVLDGKVTFEPNPGFVGTVSVKYQVTDTSGKVAESTLTVTVVKTMQIPTTGSSPQPSLLAGLMLILLGLSVVLMRRRLLLLLAK